MIPQPWLLALALQADGWYLRSDVIWHKPNPMPESVTDRPTKSHEYVFLLTKRARYFYDAEAVKEKAEYGRRISESNAPRSGRMAMSSSMYRNCGDSKEQVERGRHETGVHYEESGRNLRSVWTIPTHAFPGAHFATFPPRLVEPCVKAGTSERGCCPECGAPWKRIVESKRVPTRPGENTKIEGTNSRMHVSRDAAHPGEADGKATNRRPVLEIGNRDPQRHVSETVTTGWQPTCKCDAGEPVPCLVFDPFTGAGTAGLVARRLGRRFVGTELNAEYAAMARKRIIEDAPLFNGG